ncbi:hypothetical protein EV424DRAFT_1355930 [Suillus variegatus]|nr:hypothetical protein EV424DRAFT_1355930 [Suillus variegatus]
MPSGLIVYPISTSSSGLIVCPHLSTSYLLASLYGLPSRQTICLGDFASSSAIWPSDYESDYGPTVLPQHFAHIDPSSTKGFLSTSSSFTLASTSTTTTGLIAWSAFEADKLCLGDFASSSNVWLSDYELDASKMRQYNERLGVVNLDEDLTRSYTDISGLENEVQAIEVIFLAFYSSCCSDTFYHFTDHNQASLELAWCYVSSSHYCIRKEALAFAPSHPIRIFGTVQLYLIYSMPVVYLLAYRDGSFNVITSTHRRSSYSPHHPSGPSFA